MNCLPRTVGLRVAPGPSAPLFRGNGFNEVEIANASRFTSGEHPLVLRSAHLSIGGPDALDTAAADALAAEVSRIAALAVTTPLGWTGSSGLYVPMVLPLPYTPQTLAQVARKVTEVQEVLKCPLWIETPASYLAFRESILSETAFLTALVKRTGCDLVLDLTHVLITCGNFGLDARTYLAQLPMEAVAMLRLSGMREVGVYRVSAKQPIPEMAFTLLGEVCDRLGPLPTLVVGAPDDAALARVDTLLAGNGGRDAVA